MTHHLHSYKRHPKRKTVYMCTLPDCTHFTEKEYILGKRALCFYCLHEFIVTREALRCVKVHCDACTRGRKSIEEKRAEELVFELLAT